MKDIGIVICNYNKQDYIVNCIESVLQSSIQNFDIYMVDNASTDCSVQYVRERFGEQVNLIVNSENKGGSGGFNTGIREVLKRDYKYLMLLDNDIVLDKEAIASLYDYMQEHEEIGMLGSKAYFMDEPDKIWGYGGNINFSKYIQEDAFKNCVDGEHIPDIHYCDYVAACSLMARVEAVKKVGIMPEENFIYWDDMEWGYRFCQMGYKVAAYGKSKVWHKAGGRTAGNTFNNYYFWRNRLRFFLKELPVEKREHFADTVLTDMFRLVYSCNLKGDIGVVKSVMYAFNDAVNGISGKAQDYKIFPRKTNGNRVHEALEGAKSVIIQYNGDVEGLGNIVRNIQSFDKEIEITVSVAEKEKEYALIAEQYKNCNVVKEYCPEKYDKHLIMCEHIFKITEDMPQDTYIDSWCNIIYSRKDYVYASSFEQTKDLFLMCKKGLLLNGKTE